MAETISIQDTGKEFKIEAKYGPQDLGTENTELQNLVNKKIEALMNEKAADILANPPKKWMGMKIDRDAIKSKLEEHATAMDSLLKTHKEEITKLAGSKDLVTDVYFFGEEFAKEVKVALNTKIGDAVATAEKRGVGEVVGGGAKEASKSYLQRVEDAANSK
ncbi:hypothetical protein HZA44_01260 [Candidatus Peregrinibacteria bacterium]|nr:hypothetical protein [Candidatus Peregrinibacteria bacterium]